MDDEIVQGNYAIHYQSILRDNSEKSFEYEKMTLTFENSLINFFKSNKNMFYGRNKTIESFFGVYYTPNHKWFKLYGTIFINGN